MNDLKIQTCPDSQKLNAFLLGRLTTESVDTIEFHLSECSPCNETIEALSSKDTFTDLAREGFEGSSPDLENVEHSESSMLANLIGQMKDLGRPETTELEASESALAARSAEVQRLLDSGENENSIGKLAHYRIDELLGVGSSGVVYLATDENLNRQVALKILRPSLGKVARERFVAEAQATAAIDAANVVAIYHVGSERELAYIAMQWTPGETLAERLKREQKLSPEEAQRIGVQIAIGLAAAHKIGLIHRDIKPANIWLEFDTDNVKLLDFGLVRAADGDPQLTCTGMIAGTPSFMSPEQARGADLDCRTDYFSLGCLLYQSLTGELPFQSDNVLATLQSIQRETPVAPHESDPEIPRGLSDQVMRLLEKLPTDRPESADAIVAKLVKPETLSREIRPVSNKRIGLSGKWIFGIASCLLLLLSGFLYPKIMSIATNQDASHAAATDSPNPQLQEQVKPATSVAQDVQNSKSKQSDSTSPLTSKHGVFDLVGTCFDAEKNTIAGAEMRLYVVRDSNQIGELYAETQSAEDGSFAFPKLPLIDAREPGVRFTLICRKPGHASKRVDGYSWTRLLFDANEIGKPILPKQESVQFDVNFRKSSKVSGLIHCDGKPVSGAMVYQQLLGSQPVPDFAVAKTDEHGKFVLDDIEERLPYRTADTIGYMPAFYVEHPAIGRHTVTILKPTALLKFDFKKPTVVKGRVVFSDSNKPAVGIKVTGQESREGRRVSKFESKDDFLVEPTGWLITKTDSQGQFQITVPHGATFVVRPWKIEGYGIRAIKVVGSGEEIELGDIKLNKLVAVKGRVTSKETGQPIPKVSVGWHGPDAPKSAAGIRSTKTDEEGRFVAMVVPGENSFYVSQGGPEWTYVVSDKSNVVVNGVEDFSMPRGNSLQRPMDIQIDEDSEYEVNLVVEKVNH